MTTDDLIRIGFKPAPHFTVMNSYIYDLGRHRHLSIGAVGTPNEMMYIAETNDQKHTQVSDLICLHNYDYDGYLTEEKVVEMISVINR